MSGKKRKKKKIWLIPTVVAGTAGVLAFAGLTAEALKSRETRAAVTENADTQAAEAQTEPVSGQVSRNGKKYVYNDHLSNFLFLGIDKREKAETSQGQADAGQSDALFLLSWDRVEQEIAVISIPRDTMTEIEVFDPAGKSLGKTKDHVSLAYAYGDGGNGSCELSKKAVSNLFYGLPIQGYCAVNMDGISVMTEDIGGLTVTVPDDSLEQVHPEFQEGAQVELNGENTETFVRYRDINESQSALRRMKRQNVFLEAYAAKASEEFQRNPGFITKLYQNLQPYMVTNMGADQFAKIMKDASQNDKVSRWTVPGEGTQGLSFDEYHVEEEELYEMILEIFYEEIE